MAIQTTHVGSLPRSEALCQALIGLDQGTTARTADIDALFEQSVRDTVMRQVKAGIDIPSDGEQSKVGYSTYMLDRLSGFADGHIPRKTALDLKDHPDFVKRMSAITGTQQFRRAACTGPVALRDRQRFDEDIANMKRAMSAAGAKAGFMNAASPGLVTAFLPNQYYPTHQEYLEAVATAMQAEYEAIVAAGLLLQLDCPDLAMSRHTGFQDLTEAEFLARAESHVEAMNWALRNVPADRLRMHICWGNYEGPHDHDIPLERVLGIILKAKPAALLFESSNARHEHEWIVWRDARIPDHKILVPGVIDSRSNYVEHPELIAQRIERFTAIIGRDRVIAGTDCGFGTFAGYGKVDAEIAWKKLAALVAGARLASRRGA
jgi:5-methyltetrahydropteroyltriglutamate--homocysteine methyltransferase